MRRLLLMAAGGAVGYVLGARAGRPAYDRIVENWGRMSESMGLPRVKDRVGQSATELKDAATARAAHEMDGAVDRATDAVYETAEKVRGVDLRGESTATAWR